MTGKIFINYRRNEDRGFSRLLFDKLKSVFGEDRLFMDVEKLRGTNDFPETLKQEIRASSVLLVMIGKEWLWLEDEKGRRLGRADDFVTMEIALALSLSKVVIPILVNGVPPLQETDLPPALRQLWRCNALPLANDRFEGDVLKIAKTIGNHLGWSDADVAKALLHGSQLHQGKPLEIWLTKWDFIKTSTNTNDFIEFLKSNPPQDIAQLAATSLERLDWRDVSKNPNIENLAWFLNYHPSGEHAPEARQKAEQLRTEARLEAERQAEEARREAAEAARRLQEERIRQQRQQEEEAARQKKHKMLIKVIVASAVCLAALILGPVRYSAVTPGHWWWFQLGGALVRTFTGHTYHVSLVAFSPDGRFALSYGCDGMGSQSRCIKYSVKLWDLAVGKELRSFSGAGAPVAFSPDGRLALSRSDDKTLKLWEVATGKELRTFSGHTSNIQPAAFSPDGRFVLSGGCEERNSSNWCIKGSLKLWEVATGKELRSFGGHTEEVSSVAYSPDARFALSGSHDNTLKLWEVATGKELRTFSGHTMGVNSVAFSPDGHLALSGSADETLRLWEVDTGKELRSFGGHSDRIRSVTFSPDGRFALSGGCRSMSTFPYCRKGLSMKLWDLSRYNGAAR